jgi:hypothetical protein
VHLQQTKARSLKSGGPQYFCQIARYLPLPRAVVLCIEHDLTNVPNHIDVIELAHFATRFDRTPAA